MDRPDEAAVAAVGVDIGGTKTAVGLIARGGEILALHRIPIGPSSDALELIRVGVERTIRRGRELEREVVAIGVGVPELVDEVGSIRSNAVIAWSAEQLRAAVVFDLPVVIEADVRAAAMAEALVGAGSGIRHVLYLNLGTGISHCLVVDNQPVLGAHGRAILSGSTTMSVLDRIDGRIAYGSVEEVASGKGMVDRYRAMTGREVEVRGLFHAAAGGEPAAVAIRDDAITLIGGLLANLVDLLDPEVVVVGGGLAGASGFVDSIRSVAQGRTWSPLAKDTPIIDAALGRDSGVIGAALMTMRSG